MKGLRFIDRNIWRLRKTGLSLHILTTPSYLQIRREERKRLLPFHDAHRQSKRCFILGNGPSLNHQDLTLLKNEVTFVTNWFAFHAQYDQIQPNFYCASDPRAFEDPLNMDRFLSLLEERTKPTTKFLPLMGRPFLKKAKRLLGHEVFFLDYINIPIWEMKDLSLNPARHVWRGDTVVIDFCLPLAFFMGFEKVYLLGCDCNLPQLAQSADAQRHFYKNDLQPGTQQTDSYLTQLWFDRITASYEIVRKRFEEKDRRIFNAGAGGALEVFERVKYETLF